MAQQSARTVVVSSASPPSSVTPLGRDNYSYSFAVRQFRPLFDRWGEWRELRRPESQADYALHRARREGRTPFHLNFAPLHAAYLAQTGLNASFVFWEYPDLPSRNVAHDPRYDWARVATRVSRVLTASTFTRDAFRRARVSTPVEVVPVPVLPAAFGVPDWQPEQRVSLDIPCYIYPLPPGTPHVAAPVDRPPPVTLTTRLKGVYRACVKPFIPGPLLRRLQRGVDALTQPPVPKVEGIEVPLPVTERLDLSGVVYLHVCNPYDERKNWQDLLTAFLGALGDRDDATLVFKIVANGALLPHAINAVNTFYLDLGKSHRCRIALVGGFLDDVVMAKLNQAATYYATATRAEGANLPLMDALAAGRPALSPLHTSMLDYYESGMGWVVPSVEEPAALSVGCERLLSRWHRVDVAALADQFRESYDVARRWPGHYRDLSLAARRHMGECASLEQVWPRFRAALDSLALEAGEAS